MGSALRTRSLIVISSVPALIYAFLRYGFMKQTAIDNWPAFITNKALAFLAVWLLLLGLLRRKSDGKIFFLAVFYTAVAHAMISVALMGKSYYTEFEAATGLFNAKGELMLLLGSIALAMFLAIRHSIKPSTWLMPLLIMTTLAHVITFGLNRWGNIERWQGGLPPISLLAALTLLAALILAVCKRPPTTSDSDEKQHSK